MKSVSCNNAKSNIFENEVPACHLKSALISHHLSHTVDQCRYILKCLQSHTLGQKVIPFLKKMVFVINPDNIPHFLSDIQSSNTFLALHSQIHIHSFLFYGHFGHLLYNIVLLNLIK